MNNWFWPKRLYALDVSRGFAALAIVLWHWQHFAYVGSFLPQDFDRASQPFYAILKIFYENGSMAVDYFFLLSGFIFFWIYKASVENRQLSYGEFLLKRFSRLYPLHFTTLLIVAIFQYAYIMQNGHFFVYQFNDIYHFLLNLGFVSGWGFENGWSFNAPVWSVSIEIFLYIVFFAIVYKHIGKPRFCLGVSVMFFYFTIFYDHPFFEGLSLFFMGGYFFYLTHLISTEMPKHKRGIYFVATLSWVLTFVNFYIVDLSHFIRALGLIGEIFLLGFPLFVLYPFTVSSLALIEIDKGPFFKSISWMGDITYSSYMLHFPLQLVFGLAVAYGILNSDIYSNPVYLFVFFSILIPLSYITYVRFERPIQNKIRDRFISREIAKRSVAQEGRSVMALSEFAEADDSRLP
jgi:peptidoglycan/LPS O-acetylase OafA/YrhL